MVNCVGKVMKVMPRACKLLRYDYGSPGVLQYYYAQLNDIIQFSDLRVEVFQSFREIGNAILFCLLLEQSLVRVLEYSGCIQYVLVDSELC